MPFRRVPPSRPLSGSGRIDRGCPVLKGGMNAQLRRNALLVVPSLAIAALLGACGAQKTAVADSQTAALSAALESTVAASGTLLCAPSDGQTAACSGLAAGDACTLTNAAGTSVAGTCRATLDGSAVACAPNPPAPPPELVDACTGKAAGDTCSVTEAFGNTRSGACRTARDGATLVCGRVFAPPQAAVDACANHAAGDACPMPGRMGSGARPGTCSLGPAGTGPLACAPQKDLIPNGVEACTGLAAGDACTMGRHHERLGGTCTLPADGSAAVCVVSCADVGGRFACGPGGRGGHR